MLSKGFRSIVRAAVCMFAAALIFMSLATTKTQAATVAEFLANPTQVMAQYPNGGAELTALIRDVAIANPQALATLTSLLSSGSADQQAAVGSGLGQAYNTLINTNPAYAAQIAAAVGGSSSDSAKTSYSSATGNTTTASTGAGAVGGTGGGSGGTAGGTASGNPSGGSNSGSSGTTGQSSTQTSGNTFTGGGGGRTGGVTSSGSVSAR